MNYYLANMENDTLESKGLASLLKDKDYVLGINTEMEYNVVSSFQVDKNNKLKNLVTVKSGYDLKKRKCKSLVQSKGYARIKREEYEKIYQELIEIKKYDQERDFNYLLDRNLINPKFGSDLIDILLNSPKLLKKNLEILCNINLTKQVIGSGFPYEILKKITEQDKRDLDEGNTGITKDSSGNTRYYKNYFEFEGNYYLLATYWYLWSKKENKRSVKDNRTKFIRWLKEEYYHMKHDTNYLNENEEIEESNDQEMEKYNIKEQISRIKNFITSQGFTYTDGLIENYYLSLKTKPFVILAGISGTGKTRLVKLFAEAVGSTVDNGRMKIVPVHPDWSDSTDLLGHLNLDGKFVPGAIIDFVKQASLDLKHPYFLCLDEMNLARVEYYFSDFLSVIETRDMMDNGIIQTIPLVTDDAFGMDDVALEKYGNLMIPENLYVIGTVNMDDSTFPFSRKVLDRANTIEFSDVMLIPEVINDTESTAKEMNNTFLKSIYVKLKDAKDEWDDVIEISTELDAINKVLAKDGDQIGYRIRDEIVFYMLNNKHSELLSNEDAFDFAVLQKILPRLQGSQQSLKDVLCELFKRFAGDFEGYNNGNVEVAVAMFKKVASAKYPRCAKKIAYMVRRFEEDGFTSYWL